MATKNITLVIGTVLIVLAVFSGITLEWIFDKDMISLRKDGSIIARERWVIEAERTYFNLDSWYDRNIKCPKVVSLGGYISTSGTRCYYPDNYYGQLSRSLIGTEISSEETDTGYLVTKKTPNYAYGTRGSYAGYVTEEFNFIDPTFEEEEFPQDYNVKWEPKDTRNYRLIWRVEDLKQIDLADGNYSDCSYTFGDVMIDLGISCSSLDYAEVKGDRIWFYFLPERENQYFDVSLVDPVEINTVLVEWSTTRSEHLIRGDNKFYTFYKSGFSTLSFCDSTLGDSWSCSDIRTNPDFNGAEGILINSTGGLFIYYEHNTGEYLTANSSIDDGVTWNAEPIWLYDGKQVSESSCAIDGNDVIHCCSTSYLGNLTYANSTSWGNTMLVNGNLLDDTDYCDIEVYNNCVYIIGSGSDQNDIDIWSNCLSGWGDGNRVSVNGVPGGFKPSISINSAGDIFASWEQNGDIWFAVSDTGGSSWSSSQLTSSTGLYHEPDIATPLPGNVTIIYGNSSTSSSAESSGRYRLYSVDDGTTWSDQINMTDTDDQPGSFSTIADSMYPSTNRNVTTNSYVFHNNTNFFYDNFNFVPIAGPTDSCTYSSGNWVVDLADNCEITSNVVVDGSDILFSGTGSFTVNGANITGFSNVVVSGASSSSIVSKNNGGFKQ